jgi:hypothetical protein
MSKNLQSKTPEKIVINESEGLVFDSETALYTYFAEDILKLEKEFFAIRANSDFPEAEFGEYEGNLNPSLEDPDEIWEDTSSLGEKICYVYIKNYGDDLWHVAVCYLTDETPSFVYLHFPTNDAALVEKYRRGECVFSPDTRDIAMGAIEGDSLYENDPLAVGLYSAMMMLRSPSDIPETQFLKYEEFREPTLEEADEIWRSADSTGNVLVSFIKEVGEEEELFYIAVTLEDAPSGSHALLFSFPSSDKGLVDRYRHGENLQADEVVQESSH